MNKVIFWLKMTLYSVIFYSGVGYILRLFYSNEIKNKIRIVYIHQIIDRKHPGYALMREMGFITSEDFEVKLRYMLRTSGFIPLKEYCRILEGCPKAGGGFVLTFDDGYECLYSKVLPILRKYRIPATVFITTGCLDNKVMLLHDQIIAMISLSSMLECTLSEFPGRVFKLSSLKEKKKTFEILSGYLKTINHERRLQLMEELLKVLKVEKEKVLSWNNMLSWSQIEAMLKTGLITIGGHTVSHPILTRVPISEADQEIRHSKEEIEEHLGVEVKFFAYPNGRLADYNGKIKEIVKDSGYSMAFTTIEDNWQCRDWFEIPRYGLNKEPFFLFALRMDGFFDFLHSLKNLINHRCKT